MTTSATDILRNRFLKGRILTLFRNDLAGKVCDTCFAQDPNDKHYCLLWGQTVLNMDIMCCNDWQPQEE